MKILQVISMGHICGGAEKSVVMLRDGLRAKGHEVKIMSSDRDAHLDVIRYNDYEFKHIAGPLRILSHLWNMSAYRTLKRAIYEFKPDVVHFHTMGELSPSVLFATQHLPAILTVHGPEKYTKTILEWGLPPSVFKGDMNIKNLTLVGRFYYIFFKYFQRPLYTLGFRRLRLMVSPSAYLAEQLEKEKFKVPIRHVYNGIELPSEQPLPTSYNLLYVGRLERVKGVEILLRAMAEIIKSVPTVHLRIVGDGPDKLNLEKLAKQLNISKTVTFCGWLKGDDVLAEYKNTRVLVIPSLWPENLPTVALEALAVGRPIIGSRVGGIPELVEDGVSGFVIEPGSIEDLAKAAGILLTDPDISQKAKAARISAMRFRLEKFIGNIEYIYIRVKK